MIDALKLQYMLISVFTSIFTLLLAVFIYLQGKSKKLNIIYSFWALCVGLWSFFLVLNVRATSQSEALLWCRMLHVWAIVIPAAYVHFVLLFLNKYEQKKNWVLTLYVISAVFVFIDFTPWFLSTSYRPRFGFYITQPLSLYLAHLLVFLGTINYVYYELIKSLLGSEGHNKKQIKYFFIATLSAYSGGITNYLINYDLLVYPLYPYGNLGVLAYVILIGFMIVRFRFMDIEVIIKKTLIFAGLTSFVFGVFAGITFLVKEILSTYVQVPSIVANIASIGIVVMLYDPLRNFLVNITDKFLSQKKFNYAKVLRETSKDIALVTSLNELTRRIIAVLVRKAKTKNTAIFVRSVKDGHLELKGCYGYGRKNRPDIVFQSDSTLVTFLDEHQQPFTRQQIEEEKAKAADDKKRNRLSIILQLMNILKAQVVVPSFLGSSASEITGDQKAGSSLRSLLILGEKKSDEDYYEEDIDMLATLAQEYAIAFENARLFDEAIQRSKELEAMNAELVKVQTDLLGALNDTELASKKLHEAQAALIVAEKNATMVGMAKAIGHEVNNPLSTVAGRAMFIQKTRLPKVREIIERYRGKITAEEYDIAKTSFEKIDDDSNRIATCAKRIEIVVKTLTGIMKESTGEMQPLSFLVLWKEATEAVRFNTYEENLSSCEIIEGIASNLIVQGNLEQLIQVFLNLIKNAYEAMMGQAEKCITVKADVDPDDPRYALIVVSDNGPGIPPEALPKIWGQGFSTKKKNSSDIGAVGQGQGLYIVKHMVESVHKGTIIAESLPGLGTSFIVRLPIAEEHVVRTTDNSDNR